MSDAKEASSRFKVIRVFFLLVIIFILSFLLYILWSPGILVKDGSLDKQSNGIWLQHGWIGHDSWFQKYSKDKSKFRNSASIKKLHSNLKDLNIKFVYPHLCPSDVKGQIALVDDKQAELFLDTFNDFEVIPWIGGVLDENCIINSEKWVNKFCLSIEALISKHPRFSGVQINIEPLPSGNQQFLILLEQIREALPSDKILSVSAYPPPTLFHQYKSVHWEEEYFREVSKRVDQVVPMMYDTSLKFDKLYINLMSQWTIEIIDWSEGKDVLLGIPAYEDDADYHTPEVENVLNAIKGISQGLLQLEVIPENYKGICIYSEWTLDEAEKNTLIENFLKK